jgi:hypothetical protein
MKIKSLIPAGFVLLAVLAVWPAESRAEVNVSINIGAPPVVVSQYPWEPPPSAPQYYTYNYYPALGVYFDPGRGLYFYLEANNWRSSPYLPPYIVIQDLDYVILRMGGPEPQRHHMEVERHYPRDQWVRRDRTRSPRPWEPRPGTRNPYRYRYYPSSGVYFDPGRNLYFYPEGKVWRSSPARPRHIDFPDNDYIFLDMDSPEPDRHHKEVEKQYPRGQWKQYENERRHDDEGDRNRDRDKDRDRDRDGKGGNGKGKGRDRD